MAAAFRMALRDLDTALESADPRAPADPPGIATRVHFRATPRVVKEVRRHLQAAIELVQREARRGGTANEREQRAQRSQSKSHCALPR